MNLRLPPAERAALARGPPIWWDQAMPVKVVALLVAVGAIALVPGSATSAPSCLGRTPTIVDGAGSSRIQGTPGGDVIFAGAGNDTIAAGDGVDYVCGGDGDDTMDAGTGDDLMDGGAGGDFLDGRRGREDVLIAGPGRDELIGGSLQKGGGGNDRLDSAGYRRETGMDRLLGGAGDDRIRGDGQGGF